ncbi:EndoS/ChiA family endoglycosidase [Mucilaginibacter sp. NFX135]|uniref:EndoS/ChiA family endoglycosidase n=1 Tax=Mucilaginibacter sp. NFX135 TaxID=3402687 RepID=UPI003AFA4466
MKKNIFSFKAGILLIGLSALFAMQACKKDNGSAASKLQTAGASKNSLTTLSAASDSALVAYKKTKHEITAGFYRSYGSPTGGGTDISGMANLPDSLDIAIAFGFSNGSSATEKTQMKNTVIPALHTKGTRVILTGNLDIPSGVPHTTAGYQTTAKLIMDSLVNKYGFDGFDIDVESNPSGTTLTDMTGVYTALSAYLGPKSGTGKLLTFDTNQTGTNSLFRNVYTMIDYVWLQAYGRGTSGFQSTWNTFSAYITSDKFVPGFSFYEENGYPSNYWDDVTYPENGTGRTYDYAGWEPTTGKKGGVFGYAIDRDAPLTSMHDNTNRIPDYKVTKDLIKIMNPTGGGGGTATGVVFYQNSSYGGTAAQKIAKGNYTLAQLQAKGFVNDWASSAQIPSGWTVIMYSNDNFSGTSWTLTANNSWFGALSPSANDVVSSVKIQ